MLKLAYVVLGIAVLVGLLLFAGVSLPAAPVHGSFLADGTDPVPDPLPLCLPPWIPCPGSGGQGNLAEATRATAFSADIVLVGRRERAIVVRPA